MATDEELRAWAWKHGRLYWKLDPSQREVYAEIRRWQREQRSLWGVLDIARRWGKDTVSICTAFEDAWQNPGIRIPYGAQTEDAVKELLIPTAEWLLEDCPPQMRPEWQASSHSYEFKNGSRLIMCGLDYKPDRLRGPRMHRGFMSEAGFVSNLRYVVQSIFLQMMQGVKGAFLLMNSTPPPTPQHDWSSYFVPEAKRRNVYAHRTIYDNPRLSDAEREMFIAEAGGQMSTVHRRENLAEHIIEESRAVIPEFHDAEPDIVRPHERPPHFDAYVAVDVGYHDLTAALFGYWDFRAGKMVIEDEYVVERQTSATIVDALRRQEQALWSKAPWKRVADAPEIVLADMSNTHGYHIALTLKDDKEAAINALRLAIQRRELVIHPRCKTLISHLKHAVWNNRRSSFERSGDFGHFDCVDAAVYFVRSIVRGRNPYPPLEGLSEHTHFINHARFAPSKGEAALARAFTPRFRR